MEELGMLAYRPEKYNGLNEHVFGSALKYASVSVVCGLIAVFCLWLYPAVAKEDTQLMIRWVVDRTIRVIFAFTMAAGWLIYLDWKTNGNIIKAIIQTPMSAAIFGGLTFLGVVLLCIGG